MKQIPPERFLFPVKTHRLFRLPLLLVMTAGALLPAWAWGQVDLKSAFVAPSFVVNETVVGKEGWELTNPPGSAIYTDPDEARVIETPLHDSGQQSTLSLKTAIKNLQIANPGNVFRMEAQLAVAYNHQYQLGGGVYFQFSRAISMGPFHFGFAYGKDGEPGGLYYSGREGRVLVLPKDQMVENAPYRFVFDVDMGAEQFKVEVTGKDISGNEFRYRSEEVRFQEEYHPFKNQTISLYVGNERPTLVDAYVDYVKIIRQ
jgi:hypothetical protein